MAALQVHAPDGFLRAFAACDQKPAYYHFHGGLFGPTHDAKQALHSSCGGAYLKEFLP